MNDECKAVESLRDGNVFFAPDNERLYRVHRARPVSCFGQQYVELIARDADLPLTPLVALLYERGRRVPIALDRR